MVERLFLVVPRGCLRFVIVAFPDHTHLLFLVKFLPVLRYSVELFSYFDPSVILNFYKNRIWLKLTQIVNSLDETKFKKTA